MKTITIKIPTSFKEWRSSVKRRVIARQRHNQDVLMEFTKAISREAQSEYWCNDISDTMLRNVFRFDGASSTLMQLYCEFKNKLK